MKDHAETGRALEAQLTRKLELYLDCVAEYSSSGSKEALGQVQEARLEIQEVLFAVRILDRYHRLERTDVSLLWEGGGGGFGGGGASGGW